MIEIGPEGRKVSERTAGWLFAGGGVVFIMLVVAMAIAHFAFGMPINGEVRTLPPSGDLLIFFPVALVLGAINVARGIWILRRLK